MKYAIGIDTGGTYTDAVLLNTEKNIIDRVERKAKAETTHQELEIGINNSIKGLCLSTEEISQIEKVVLSTTLATNAIVEDKVSQVGLISIGERPKGDIATTKIIDIDGQINIKGRIIIDANTEQIQSAIKDFSGEVAAIAVSGASSVRNPVLEQKVKSVAEEMCDLPVICGHEIVSGLGFLERTNTAILNAGLLSIIAGFIKAINNVLNSYGINAPVFAVKGDGSITKLESIRSTPIETALSGPAASMIGAINLTGLEDAVVADMGGTTTDMGTVRQKRVELSPDGTTVGGWKIRIKSAKLYTFGLGGDSHIRSEEGKLKIGPRRVYPMCRGGDSLTPTDLLHYTEEFLQWERNKSVDAVEKHAQELGFTTKEYIAAVKQELAEMIRRHILEYVDLTLPVCAIGAPAETWYNIVHGIFDFDLVIPKHYEVANAVGAATAAIQEIVEVIVRQGEDGYGYLVHVKDVRHSLTSRTEAIQMGIKEAYRLAAKAITEQNLNLTGVEITGFISYNYKNELVREPLNICNAELLDFEERGDAYDYIETKIEAYARGNIFVT